MEFALVLPVLVMLVFGMLTGGILYNQQLALTQAAREGARYGATLPLDIDSPSWEQRVEARVLEASNGMLDPAGEAGHSIDIVEPDPDAGEDRVIVSVERPGWFEIVMFELPQPTLSAESIARHEG